MLWNTHSTGKSRKVSRKEVIILQRLIPHYRIPLFNALCAGNGVLVVCAKNPPGQTNLKLSGTQPEPWRITYPFKFPDPQNEYRAKVPVGQILRDLTPHTVIAEFSMSMDSTWKLALARRLGRIKQLVFWHHGWNMSRGFASFGDKVSQFSRLLPYAMADAHIVYSQEGATYLRQISPRKPIFVARNTQAIDVSDDAVSQSITQSATRTRPYTIVASGRLTPDKQFPKLVALFKGLLEREPNARLVIVGDGPDRAAVERETGDLLNNQVVLHGLVYEAKKLAEIFLDADVAAYAGAVGLAVNQALAYGLPFVTFERSFHRPPYHHPEIAYVVPGLTGVQVQHGDDRAFIEALANFAADRKRLLRFRRTAREYYTSELTMDNYVDDFETALRSLMSG